MPIELARDVLRFVISVLEVICLAKAIDGFFGASSAAQVVSVHVLRVRDVRSCIRIGEPVFERLIDVSYEFVGVNQVMMGGEVAGCAIERGFIKSDGRRCASLSAAAD